MRPLALILLLAAVAQTADAGEPEKAGVAQAPSPVQAEPGAQPGAAGPHTTTAPPAYPLWDGQETIEQYARRGKLEPTKTLDLGNGVKLEMVLIPAGKFIMGTKKPERVDEEGFANRIWLGQFALCAGISVLLVLLGVVAIRAVRQRRRPQYSLARFVAMVVVAGIGLLGGLHWHYSVQGLSDAMTEEQVAVARYTDVLEDEKPAHEVTLTTPYYMGKFEVTQEQYEQVMGTNPSAFRDRLQPVERVSWDEAQGFCKKASEKTASTIRLPTEAEWERSCRAGTRTKFCSGDADGNLNAVAWFGDNYVVGTAHPVGQKKPNTWGLYDMHGNAGEWCVDWYAAYTAAAVADPQGPARGRERVVRGGGWTNFAFRCRSASRHSLNPGSRHALIGFRVAASVPLKAP